MLLFYNPVKNQLFSKKKKYATNKLPVTVMNVLQMHSYIISFIFETRTALLSLDRNRRSKCVHVFKYLDLESSQRLSP